MQLQAWAQPRLSLASGPADSFDQVVSAIADLLDSLAWPIVAVVVFVMLREPISDRIRNLKSVSGGGVKAEFDEAVKDVEERSREAIDEQGDVETSTVSDSGPIADLVEKYPRGAVLESWLLIERELREAARRSGVQNVEHATANQIVKRLRDAEVLEPAIAAIIRDLQGLRNSAAHSTDFELSIQAGQTYVSAASAVAAALESIATATEETDGTKEDHGS